MQIVFSLLLYDLVAIIKSYDITWRLHFSNTPLPAALFIIARFNDVLCLLILNICVFFFLHLSLMKPSTFTGWCSSSKYFRFRGHYFGAWEHNLSSFIGQNAMYIIGLFGLFYTTVTCYTCSPYLLCLFRLFCLMSERLYRMEIRDFKHAVMSFLFILFKLNHCRFAFIFDKVRRWFVRIRLRIG